MHIIITIQRVSNPKGVSQRIGQYYISNQKSDIKAAKWNIPVKEQGKLRLSLIEEKYLPSAASFFILNFISNSCCLGEFVCMHDSML